MALRSVVVTGLGVISALGKNVDAFSEALFKGESAIGPMELVDRTRLRFKNAAEVRGHCTEEHFSPERAALLDRFAEFGLIASREAIRMSGIDWTPTLAAHSGIVTGTALGGQTTEDVAFVDLYARQRSRVNPLSIPRVMANALASHISMETGITGPVFTVSTACSSANHAIGHAFWMIRSGIMEAAIAGGSEAPMSYANLKAWEAMRVVSPDTCRPFSRTRSGLILGEGGGILILESLEHARARGAGILGEIVGFGMSADAHHITQPAADGAGKAMRAALSDAGLPPEAIGYVNAHGTGTLANDSMEVSAIHNVFGDHARKLAVSSTKSLHGHALGAAGALEAVATILALGRGILPPTANYQEHDPECDIDVIPNQARQASCEYAMSNSFAFGGLNAVLVFRGPR